MHAGTSRDRLWTFDLILKRLFIDARTPFVNGVSLEEESSKDLDRFIHTYLDTCVYTYVRTYILCANEETNVLEHLANSETQFNYYVYIASTLRVNKFCKVTQVIYVFIYNVFIK